MFIYVISLKFYVKYITYGPSIIQLLNLLALQTSNHLVFWKIPVIGHVAT